MRFPQVIRISILLVVTLATLSVVSSLSIPRKLDAQPALFDLVKRIAKNEAATTARQNASPNAPPNTSRRAPATSANPRPAPPPSPSPAPPVASSLSAPASASPPRSSAQASPAATSASQLNSLSTTQTGTGLNSTATNAEATPPVPTGGLSSPAIGGIACLGGVAVLGAAIFAVMRYRRKASLTQNLGTKSINQFSGNSPYAGAPFPSGGNTGYERLSDPQLSGALAPGGAPSPLQQQQALGTYTVISTYTPTLGDELEIQSGDQVTILVEYDDGWCQGINESRGRVKGVFPKHCVDMGHTQGGMDDMEKGKRVSSMYGAGGYRM